MISYADARARLESGFYGFWVRNARVSYLLTAFLSIAGVFWIIALPKEQSPTIEFGTILISTPYPGANPADIDALITDKIYQEIKDIEGVKKITSRSSLGSSVITAELKTDAKTSDVLSDIRSAIAPVGLPEDAENPIIQELKTDAGQVVSVTIGPKEGVQVPSDDLWERMITLKEALEKTDLIKRVDVGDNYESFDAWIILDAEKIRSSGLSVSSVADYIRASNRNTPLGNFDIGSKKYDFRIAGKIEELNSLLALRIPTPQQTSLLLSDVATIERHYGGAPVREFIIGSGSASEGRIMTVYKNDGSSIFAASDNIQSTVNRVLATPEFSEYRAVFTGDLVEAIRDDYGALGRDAIITVVLVFINMFLLIGFKDAVISTLLLPLAYFATFGILYSGGYSLNFLTNFSLVLSFGIAIDTIIVIVQGAGAKSRLGYDPSTAVLLAIREYSIPLIAGVMTSIVAFLPMITLPGVLGKFLAYIPITIFGVLATGLILALTLNSALYTAFVKRSKTYVATGPGSNIDLLPEDERILLITERAGKTPVDAENATLRQRVIEGIIHWYSGILVKFLRSTFLRRISIIIPIALIPISIMVLGPLVWFKLFPSGDNPFLTISIEGPVGSTTSIIHAQTAPVVREALTHFPEIKVSQIITSGNTTTASVELLKTAERKKLALRDSFTVESEIVSRLASLREKGFNVQSQVQSGGPPTGKAVGIKLVADSPEKLNDLIAVSKEFEAHLRTLTGAKNVATTSQDTPGQFVITLKRDVIDTLGVSPALVNSSIISVVNGSVIGAIQYRGLDIDMRIKSSKFLTGVDPGDLANEKILIAGRLWRVGDLADIRAENAIASIASEDGDIVITVESDVETSVVPTVLQAQMLAYAESYNFPEGISTRVGGENAENADLIQAAVVAFVVALVAMFMILVLQFNSFSQPALVLYSVLTAISWVLLGLWLTGNPMSMPFAIGFIAFTGIGVNHAIILLDAVNINLQRGMTDIEALVEAGSSRFEPMLLTTLTTVFGILPLALKDEFWAGLGFTVIFGLIFASFMTLFVVKGVYYEIYLKPKNPRGGIFKRSVRWILRRSAH